MTASADSTSDSTPSRPRCQHCLRPLKTCICHLVQLVDNTVEVIILQHPLEVKQTKSTGRLLHLCLKNSQLIAGEQLEGDTLKKLLTDDKETLLLYPPKEPPSSDSETESTTAVPEVPEVPEVAIKPNTDKTKSRAKRLIVLDGTWRKTRKMLHLNPLLADLPRLQLPDNVTSNYRIRKAHLPGQLSTLEATTLALAELEQDLDKYQPVLESFIRFIDQQIAQMGKEVFEKHYNC